MDMARGYDAAAPIIHPHYEKLQAHLLTKVAELDEICPHVVDLGAGSGRWASLFLEAIPSGRATLVDQSQPFFEIARSRLDATRASFVTQRLQDEWPAEIEQPVHAIVSMSAIHHLESAEKLALYQRCFDLLAPGGLLLNGDEIRPVDSEVYLREMQMWGRHMQALIAAQLVTPAMAVGLTQWQLRNIDRFEEPRHSGDDCHDTAETQLDMLRQIGFVNVELSWSSGLWGCLHARKPAK
jgi:tRNA (cmo5U34)-methyltransferase